MLESIIIEELLEQERPSERLRIRPHLERQRPYPYGEPIERRPPEPEQTRDEDWDNGVIYIDM